MEGRSLMVGGGTGVAEAAGSATGVGGREPPEMRKTVAQGGSLPLSDRGGVEGGRRMPAGVLGAGGGWGWGWVDGKGLTDTVDHVFRQVGKARWQRREAWSSVILGVCGAVGKKRREGRGLGLDLARFF